MRRTALLVAGAASALVIATAGTAGVQALITGAQIKDGTIESRDIENGTIRRADIGRATLSSLRGPRGRVGAQGPRGAIGPQGAAGATGPAGPQGLQGATGAPGAAGAAGADGALAGYEIVTGAPVAIAGTDFVVSASATCPVGKVATGGGVSIADPAGGVVMVESRPVALGAGWFVSVANFSEDPNSATPYAVCADAA